jgi:hypothetical protein
VPLNEIFQVLCSAIKNAGPHKESRVKILRAMEFCITATRQSDPMLLSSLRWHYPNQVYGFRRYSLSQPALRKLPTFFIIRKYFIRYLSYDECGKKSMY